MISNTDSERVEGAAARMADAKRFKQAIRTIDALNEEDPKRVGEEESALAYELYFSRLLFEKALSLDSDASEALLLAARSQHICRWKMPRSDFPMDRAGYLKWRSDLKRYHATVAAGVLGEVGYDEATIDQVRAINLKQDLKGNPDAQTMEDALCLVFLEVQFSEFRLKTSEEKMISILRKTWGKMGERGREAALGLALGEEETRLLGLALAG